MERNLLTGFLVELTFSANWKDPYYPVGVPKRFGRFSFESGAYLGDIYDLVLLLLRNLRGGYAPSPTVEIP